MNAINDIRIEWDGPYNLKDIGYDHDQNDYKHPINAKLNDKAKDCGVYQVYGNHPIYGNNVLLYIGKAVQQTFGYRLSQERWEYNSDRQNIQFYVGRLFNIEEEKQPSHIKWIELIDKTERMLIYAHSPAGNSSNIRSINQRKNKLKEFEDIRIYNYDNYRSLMPEISGAMWVRSYNNCQVFTFKI